MDIKEERLKRQMTQKAFSRLVGYNIRTIQRWEKNQLGMSERTERIIENILSRSKNESNRSS